jgi:endonuclease YncB( thermonuclease family)
MPASRGLRIRPPKRRRWRALALAALLLASIAGAALWRPGEPSTLEGAARIIDGDSIEVRGENVRLKGIDAPEMAQTCRRAGQTYSCGETARRHLAALVAGGPVRCRIEGRDRFRRFLGVCEAGPRDLNLAMVRDGWAVGYRGYADAEREARDAGRGLWAGAFERPRDWRRAHAASAVPGGDEIED